MRTRRRDIFEYDNTLPIVYKIASLRAYDNIHTIINSNRDVICKPSVTDIRVNDIDKVPSTMEMALAIAISKL
jgi:hypothetical protein